jgi:hypothetical protein
MFSSVFLVRIRFDLVLQEPDEDPHDLQVVLSWTCKLQCHGLVRCLDKDLSYFRKNENMNPILKSSKILPLFGPYRSHFLSKKNLIAAKNETKEERRKIGERDTTSACE